ncbi:chaperonin 10-like protein [Aspergillus ambiguus]|uniref:NAD(P)-dependent alcohol dehydrogenase n=1 Tax=Aspergillus ambiguus TaxID=176160 RepID=UPI003CCCCB2F
MVVAPAIIAHEPEIPGHPNWQLEEVSVSDPGDHEVLVEMIAVGICHTDIVLSSVSQGSHGIDYPKIAGHEGAGYVRQVGEKVKSVKLGDPVLLSFYSCGSCAECDGGHPAYCDSFAKENYVGRKGLASRRRSSEGIWTRFFGQSSFSQYSVVDESCLVNATDLLQDANELKLFAPLGCGFQTGMGAIENITNAGPDDVVIIAGMGSVGMASLMTAAIRGCRGIIAVDRLSDRLELARGLGATHIIDTSQSEISITDAVQHVFPNGASIFIDTTGLPGIIESGLKALKQRGKLVLIGVPPSGYRLSFDATEHINKGRSVMGCIEGDSVPKAAIPRMIQWYREGRFPFDKLITFFEARSFDKALSQLHQGSAVKAVLVWNTTN